MIADTYTALYSSFVVVGAPQPVYRPFLRGPSEILAGTEETRYEHGMGRSATFGHTNMPRGSSYGLPFLWTFAPEVVRVICNRQIEHVRAFLDEGQVCLWDGDNERVFSLYDAADLQGYEGVRGLRFVGNVPFTCDVQVRPERVGELPHVAPRAARPAATILRRVQARAPVSAHYSTSRLEEHLHEMAGLDRQGYGTDAKPNETTFWIVMEGPASMPVV